MEEAVQGYQRRNPSEQWYVHPIPVCQLPIATPSGVVDWLSGKEREYPPPRTVDAIVIDESWADLATAARKVLPTVPVVCVGLPAPNENINRYVDGRFIPTLPQVIMALLQK